MQRLRRVGMMGLVAVMVAAFGCGSDEDKSSKDDTPETKSAKATQGNVAKNAKGTLDAKIVGVNIYGEDKGKPWLSVDVQGVKDARVRVSEDAPPTLALRGRILLDISVPKDAELVFQNSNELSITFQVEKLAPGDHSFTLTVFTKTAEKVLPVKFRLGGELSFYTKSNGMVILKCKGRHSCSGQFGRMDNGKTSLVMKGPAGTKVTLGKLTGSLTQGEPLTLTLSPEALLALLASKTLAQLKNLGLACEMSFSDGVKLSAALPIDAWGLATEWLLDAEETGSRLAKEPPYTGKPRGLYAQVEGRRQKELFGDPKTLQEIDLVALVRKKTSKRACGKYRGINGKSVRVYAVRDVEKWSVYNRRTGRRVKSRTFKPDFPKCPSKVKVSDGNTTYSSWVDASKVDAWLKSLLN